MPILLSKPVDHKTQEGVKLDRLAIETLVLENGCGINVPAKIRATFVPYASVTKDGVEYQLTQPPDKDYSVVIPDLFKWAKERAAEGDMVPLNCINLLVQAAGEEYLRQNPEA